MGNVAAEEFDHGQDVGGLVGGVIKDRIELVADGTEKVVDNARLLAVPVDAADTIGKGRGVAVEDRDIVSTASQFFDEMAANVAVAAGDEDAHAGDGTRLTWELLLMAGDAGPVGRFEGPEWGRYWARWRLWHNSMPRNR